MLSDTVKGNQLWTVVKSVKTDSIQELLQEWERDLSIEPGSVPHADWKRRNL